VEVFTECCADKVAFAEVECMEEQVLSFQKHQTGYAGMPTIKMFDSYTGIQGAHYKKKTDMEMCDELSLKYDYMNKFIADRIEVDLAKLEL